MVGDERERRRAIRAKKISKVVIIKHTLSLSAFWNHTTGFFFIDNIQRKSLKSKACSRRRRRCRRARARLLEQRSFSRRRRRLVLFLFNSFAFSIGFWITIYIQSRREQTLSGAALFNEERSFEGESIVSFYLSLTFAWISLVRIENKQRREELPRNVERWRRNNNKNNEDEAEKKKKSYRFRSKCSPRRLFRRC